jgi:nitroreductase
MSLEASSKLSLEGDHLLSTTRAVRRRLDLTRPVPRDLICDCVRMALQAPSGGNAPTMRFVVIMDSSLRREIAFHYRASFAQYRESDSYIGKLDKGDPRLNASQQRSAASAEYLSDHLEEVPAIVIACHLGRLPDSSPTHQVVASAAMAIPAMWSFMLAARNRGLGTAWTTLHLHREREIAAILNIPYESVTQVCLTPLAFTLGTEFRPVSRPPAEDVIHWDRWQ